MAPRILRASSASELKGWAVQSLRRETKELSHSKLHRTKYIFSQIDVGIRSHIKTNM